MDSLGLGWQHCTAWVSEWGQKPGGPQTKSESQGEFKKEQTRKNQFIFKLVDAWKSLIYKIIYSLPRNSFAYLLHVYCFLQISPRKGKDHSEGLATLSAPLRFSRAPFKGMNINLVWYSIDPPGSTGSSAPLWCQELCHPPQVTLLICSAQSAHCTTTSVPLFQGYMSSSAGRCWNIPGNEGRTALS